MKPVRRQSRRKPAEARDLVAGGAMLRPGRYRSVPLVGPGGSGKVAWVELLHPLLSLIFAPGSPDRFVERCDRLLKPDAGQIPELGGPRCRP